MDPKSDPKADGEFRLLLKLPDLRGGCNNTSLDLIYLVSFSFTAGAETPSNHSTNHKRVRELLEVDESSGDSKRPLLEQDSALEEVLSDISDDADEILNREDSVSNMYTSRLR